MSTNTPFSLRIFVVDGDPDGLRLVERSNWVGKAIIFPRAVYTQVRNRRSSSRPAFICCSARVPRGMAR